MTGALAAACSALAGLFALVLYFYRRHDGPAAVRARIIKAAEEDMEDVDEALGEMDAGDLTRSYVELYDRIDVGLRRQDGTDNAGRQDFGQP